MEADINLQNIMDAISILSSKFDSLNNHIEHIVVNINIMTNKFNKFNEANFNFANLKLMNYNHNNNTIRKVDNYDINDLKSY